MSALLLAVSTLLQLAAAGLSLRLVSLTRRKVPWLLLTAAILIMAFRRLLLVGESIWEGKTHVDPAGEFLPLLVSAFLLAGLWCVKSLFADITRAEHEAVRRGRDYQLLLDLLPHGVEQIGPDGRILRVNPALCRMFGYSDQEMVGRLAWDFAPDAEASARLRERFEAIKRDQPPAATLAVHGRRKDGRIIDLSLEWDYLRGESGELAGFIAVLTDVTERKRALDRLRESEERFRTMADFTYDWEYWVAPDGRLLYVSPSCERITGYPAGDFLADPALMLRILHPEDAEAEAGAHFSSRPTSGPPRAMDFRILTKDGRLRWVSHVCQAVHGRDGAWLGRRASNRDITERKELELLRQDVERISRHDLKGPLLASLALPRLLKSRGPLSPDQLELLEDFEKSGTRMLTMVNRSLDLFKMETGAYRLEPVNVDLAAVCRDVVAENGAMVRDRPAVDVVVDGALLDRAAPFLVRGEEHLCHSMISSLLQNAIEASPPSAPVSIAMRRESFHALVDISNDGEVPPAIRDRFFEKYVTYGKKFGTGLGTYSAKLMAETQGGSIALDASTPGRTTVTIRLPVA